jgi:hypothetical protein
MSKHLLRGKGIALPAITGILTVLSMFAANAYRIGWSDLVIPLGLGIVVGITLYGLFWYIPITRKGASITAAIATACIMLWMLFPWREITAGVIIVTIVAMRQTRVEKVGQIERIAFLVIIATLCVSLVQAIIIKASPQPTIASTTTSIVLKEKPDIYFIVPDRFTSPEGLRESGQDSSNFVSELKSLGFYVREDSLSSDTIEASHKPVETTRTLRFLASVLNMGKEVEINIRRNIASGMVAHHGVGRILKTNGYTYYHIGSWYEETRTNVEADKVYLYPSYTLGDYLSGSEFSTAILERSILRYLNFSFALPNSLTAQTERNRHMFQLASLEEVASKGASPKFVFIHLMLPHPPYVWTADGQTQESRDKGEMELYLEQAKFAEGYLLEMVKAIKNDNAIVIIQADEGMCFVSEKELNFDLSQTQWNGVLTAWKIPGMNEDSLQNIDTRGILRLVIDSNRE